MKKTYIVRRYDIRPVDFDSGKRLAVPADQMETCQCCGKRIVKVCELSNGDKIGSECAVMVDIFRFQAVTAEAVEFVRGSARQYRYLAALA